MKGKEKRMVLLRLEDIKKHYELGKTKIEAVKGVSFEVEEGDFISIVGPSGCGKTTLLNILGLIDEPSSGTIYFEDKNMGSIDDNEGAETRLTKIGFIFQSFNLIPVLTIYENIEFPMILSGVKKRERKERIDHLVSSVGLDDFISHKPDELSGGQRQRVAIARSLVNQPRVVIADEPTANLDSETGGMVVELMRSLNEEQQVTFIFSTHNPEVMKYARKVFYLRDGLIEKTGKGEAA
jgi:putative ABC transport system ATP-binding protein